MVNEALFSFLASSPSSSDSSDRHGWEEAPGPALPVPVAHRFVLPNANFTIRRSLGPSGIVYERQRDGAETPGVRRRRVEWLYMYVPSNTYVTVLRCRAEEMPRQDTTFELHLDDEAFNIRLLRYNIAMVIGYLVLDRL